MSRPNPVAVGRAGADFRARVRGGGANGLVVGVAIVSLMLVFHNR